jgi:long-chain acyl-CoA synthetase
LGIDVETAASPARTGEANLASLVDRPDAAGRVALRHEGHAMSLADVGDHARRAASLLSSLGVQAGDRVALLLPNVPAFAFVYYAILRLGATVVPMNPLLREREIAYGLEQSGARLLVRWTQDPPAEDPGRSAATLEVADAWMAALADQSPLDAITPVADLDTAVILYTSGTTGRPKGAELTHRGLRLNALATCDLYSLKPGDAVLGVLPLYHSYGQTCVLNAGLSAGSTVVLQTRFEGREAVRLIDEEAIDVIAAVPTMYQDMLESASSDDAFRSVRMCQTGGAAMPLALIRETERRFGCPVVEGYGLSETSPVASINVVPPRPPGSIGVPIAGVEIGVFDSDGAEVSPGEVGELVIRGHNVMKGYWRDPDATAAAIDSDGWFHTGDLGRRDTDGFLYIVGRSNDMIIRGGLNVYPREVEEVLHEHPAVLEAAVVAVPDDRLGEEIGAAIKLAPGADVSLADVQSFVRARVAPYKYPRVLWLVEELPKGPTGKVLKREIRVPHAGPAA